MIFTVLIFGILLRIISLNQSLWLDEATTALVAKMPIADIFTKFMPNDFHPPLYYLVIRGWSLVTGGSEIALRMPSVIFGTATIYIVYLIAKSLNFKKPIIPSLFLATSGLHIYYSQEARMYGLVTLLVSYLVLTFIKRDWLKFSILLPLIFLTDYVSLIILPVLFIFSFLNTKDFKKLLYSSILLLFTFLMWLPVLLKQLHMGFSIKSGAWWNLLGPVTFKNVALIPTKFMIGRVSFSNKFLYALIITIISIIFIYVIGKAKNKLNWYWFVLSIFLGILLSFFIPTLTYFRYLFVLPAFYLLISEKANNFFVVFVLCVNLLASGFYLLDSKFHRENWREVSKVINEEKIVFPANSQKEALTYYGKEKNIVLKDTNLENEDTIWLSRYVWEIFDPDDSARNIIENTGFIKTAEYNFNGVVLWKYKQR